MTEAGLRHASQRAGAEQTHPLDFLDGQEHETITESFGKHGLEWRTIFFAQVKQREAPLAGRGYLENLQQGITIE